jgi:predicted nucleotidyltransferase component of viral defense system
MPQYNPGILEHSARQYGFNRDTFEKVLRLKEILATFNIDDYLREHMLLKGGTAINLTVFDLPRLSVDIDLDFRPNLPLDNMMEARKKVTKIISEYMASERYELSPNSRFSHSLDAFEYRYQNTGGNPDIIKIEINYSLRAHIFEPDLRFLKTQALGRTFPIICVAPMEIFAAKVNALLSRTAARDFYDINKMIGQNLFAEQEDLFRKSIVFYSSITQENPKKISDFSTLSRLTFEKIRRELFPVITREERNKKYDIRKMIEPTKEYLVKLLSLTAEEKEYLERFSQKDYQPGLLFEEQDILERIKSHPMALWRCRKNSIDCDAKHLDKPN